MVKLRYNSRDINFKTPFGALKRGAFQTFTFPVPISVNDIGAGLVLRKGEKSVTYKMRCLGVEADERYYGVEVTPDEPGIYYYRFEIYTQNGVLFVGRDESASAVIGDWLPEWQLTVYSEDYKTPEWLSNAVIYHIFPDRFSRVEDGTRPRYGRFKQWDEELTIADKDGVYRADDFYGGNIKGVTEKLPYLKDLGVTVIYFSPIFESSSNHRYDTADYLKIDSLFGTEEEFGAFLKTAKEYGIRVILDGVFNHTGSDSVYFNKLSHYNSVGAYNSKESPYYKWYTFSDYPDVYDCWWGCTVVPTVSRKAESFRKFIAGEGGVIEKWTKLGVSGWRLDVVDEISDEFVRDIRRACKNVSDEVAVIGEVWEDASTKESYGEKREYLFGKELDGVMNYPFRTAILELLRKKDTSAFVNAVNEIRENYPACSLASSMTLLGTHDTVRIINELGARSMPETKSERLKYRLDKEELERGKKLLKIAVALQFFLPGTPTVYYGDEVCMEGFEDPINRRPFDCKNKDEAITEWYRTLARAKKEFGNAPLEMTRTPSTVTLKRGDYAVIVNIATETVELKKY